MRIKLDRTVCDGFGICAAHAPNVFSLDDWGYPSLVGDGEIAPEDEAGVRRALLDCPAHAIIDLGEQVPLPAGGEPGVSRSARETLGNRPVQGAEAPWAVPVSRE